MMGDQHRRIRRAFAPSDQLAFSELSGDVNPLHMDPVYARRTQLGAAAVHGVHAALWALEELTQDGLLVDWPGKPPWRRLSPAPRIHLSSS